MTDTAISPPGSPLRRRMIEDMEVRGFTACTQRGYIARVLHTWGSAMTHHPPCPLYRARRRHRARKR